MTDNARSAATRPDLRIRNALAQSEARGQVVRINFILTGLDVDHDEVHSIAALELWPNVFLEYPFASLGEHFFAVTAFGRSHDHAPICGFHHIIRGASAPLQAVISPPSSTLGPSSPPPRG